MVSPRPRSTPAIFAHRGITPGNRENTIAAFLDAARIGADGVELDVRRSRDGALLVHHDTAIEGVGVIAELRVKEIPEWIPLLDDALRACEEMIVNVEVKNDPDDPDFDATGSLAQCVAVELSGWETQVVVSCFDLPTLDAIRGANPEIPTAFLTVLVDGGATPFDRDTTPLHGGDITPEHGDVAHLHSESLISSIAGKGHAGINVHHLSINRSLVEDAHRLGLEVAAWTVNDILRMNELALWGVDTIITNELELALAELHGE